MSESNVAIAPDNAATGAHNVRTVKVTPNLDNANPTSEEQQVVTLADDNGSMVETIEGALAAHDATTHQLLRGVILRLDLIADALCRNYSPPDNLYEEV